MRIKSIASLLVIFMCLFIFTSCGTPPSTTDSLNNKTAQAPTEPPTAGNTSDNGLASSLKHDNLKVSEDLISQFFKYYRLNSHELYLLPTFTSPEQADWDQFTLYIYMHFVSLRNEAKYENFDDVLTKEKFAETVNKYFGRINYTDRGSSYLTYDDGIYCRKPGDTTGRGYYRLINISKNTNGIYTAVLDSLLLAELDGLDSYEEATPNIKAIRDTAGTTEAMHKAEFEKTLLDIFLKPNYNEVLSMTERVTIQFTLSGDDAFPFVYKSCEKVNY